MENKSQKNLFYYIENFLGINKVHEIPVKYYKIIAFCLSLGIIYISVVHSYEHLSRNLALLKKTLEIKKSEYTLLQSKILKYEGQTYVTDIAKKKGLIEPDKPPLRIIIN